MCLVAPSQVLALVQPGKVTRLTFPRGWGRATGAGVMTLSNPVPCPQVLCSVKALLKYNLLQEAELSGSFQLPGTGTGVERRPMAGRRREEAGQSLPAEGKEASPATVKSETRGGEKAWGKTEGASCPLWTGCQPRLAPFLYPHYLLP